MEVVGILDGFLAKTNSLTLPETNIAPKMDDWKMNFLLGRPIFRGHVSFREGTSLLNQDDLGFPIPP